MTQIAVVVYKSKTMNHIKIKTFVTHAGKFHCDEVTAYAIVMLSQGLNSFQLVRLESLKGIEDFKKQPDTIVADIGRQYNPMQLLYDHHQGMLLRENDYPFATAGLIWQDFGIQTILEVRPNCSEHIQQLIHKTIDEELIMGIDAHDSDNEFNVDSYCIGGKVNVLTLPNVISLYNHSNVNDHEYQKVNFNGAALNVAYLLKRMIEKYHDHFSSIELFLIEEQTSEKIIMMNESFDFQKFIREVYPKALFVIRPSQHPGSKFALETIQKSPPKRESIIQIERSPDFKGFIHNGKWIAGSDDKDELVKLAKWNIAFQGKKF